MKFDIKSVKRLCTPAMVYFVISVVAIIMALFNSVHLGMVLLKTVFVIFWTYILNLLCKNGLKYVSWFFVLFPYLIILAIFFMKKTKVLEGASSCTNYVWLSANAKDKTPEVKAELKIVADYQTAKGVGCLDGTRKEILKNIAAEKAAAEKAAAEKAAAEKAAPEQQKSLETLSAATRAVSDRARAQFLGLAPAPEVTPRSKSKDTYNMERDPESSKAHGK